MKPFKFNQKTADLVRFFFLILAVQFCIPSAEAQHKCLSHELRKQSILNDPSIQLKIDEFETKFERHQKEGNSLVGLRGVLTIPVVVHVLWNTEEQNISDEQIESQIIGLNEDFRLLNLDAPDENHPFYFESADTYIEFCLAQQDPDGFETNGINRVWTPVEAWDESNMDDIKYTSTFGADNWDPEHYLNIWVTEFADDFGLLGYATFPDELEDNLNEDGVVIRNSAFGFVGDLTFPNDLGRTGTHEVGHWLLLRHIWGDEICGNDFVSDTPMHNDSNYECPDFPHNPFSECGSDEYGEMYMNYMDYVDDACMNMFTLGQAERMYFAIETYRLNLLFSEGCSPGIIAGVRDISELSNIILTPNPSSGKFQIECLNEGFNSFEILDMLGNSLLRGQFNVTKKYEINCEQIASGCYLIRLWNGNSLFSTLKFVKE